MAKLVLGLDIGVTSVGWGLVDHESGKIVNAGVRMFEEADSKNNADRRNFRHSRRLKRRKSFRITRLQNLLKQHGVLNNDYRVNDYNPYECRKKGLTEKLTNNELVSALVHICKLRGSSLEVAVDETNKEEGASKSVLQNNSRLLNQGKYVCEIQLQRLHEKGKIRGNENIFKTDDYLKELDKILSNQELSTELNEKIKEIIKSRRHFSEGPGGANSPTQYGRYLSLNAEPIDLIEKMRGKCSIYKNELRAPLNSYTYCLYNLLNDLNNLNIDGKKITSEQKQTIISDYINKGNKVSLKVICKVCGIKEVDKISGYRIDKSDNPLFSEFKGYNAIRRVIEKNNFSTSILKNIDVLDKIIDILTETKIIEERIERINKIICDEALSIELSKISTVSQYGYLSYKALKLFINEMENSTDNQMQISSRLNLQKEYNQLLENKKNIPYNSDDITNPVVKRAQHEAIKVINKVRKEYGELESIVIEMAREKNSKEEKKAYEKAQKRLENLNKDLAKYVADGRLTTKLRTKLRLAEEQNWKCAYTQEKIDLNVLLSDEYAYEIDHILPISLSYDDSFNNKVLVTSKANQDKSQRTPFEYFSHGLGNISFEQFTEIVLSNPNYKNKERKAKIDNLLFKGDLLNPSDQEKFIHRNLVDTRFATRNILNELQKYYKANNISTKVFTIRGSITDQFRKKANLEKNRNVYKHHAIDALILASIRNNRALTRKLDNASRKERYNPNAYEYKKDYIVNKETGELIWETIFDEPTMKIVKQIKMYDCDIEFNQNSNIKFSWKVDRKINRSISDQTIYSTRKTLEGEFLVKKYKDIYEKNAAEKITDWIKTGKQDKLLMYRHDKQTYDILESIVKAYPSESNPFLAYKNEHGPIRKYSKKGNGPEINSVKYLSNPLETFVDISHNYSSSRKRVVLQSLPAYRIDLYLDNGIYKFITIRRCNIRQQKSKYFLDKTWYEKEKKLRNISNDALFLFSIYKNDILQIEKNNVTEFYRFVAIKDENKKSLEFKFPDKNVDKRIEIGITKNIKTITKYNVDVLGKFYKVEREVLKFEF